MLVGVSLMSLSDWFDGTRQGVKGSGLVRNVRLCLKSDDCGCYEFKNLL